MVVTGDISMGFQLVGVLQKNTGGFFHGTSHLEMDDD